MITNVSVIWNVVFLFLTTVWASVVSSLSLSEDAWLKCLCWNGSPAGGLKEGFLIILLNDKVVQQIQMKWQIVQLHTFVWLNESIAVFLGRGRLDCDLQFRLRLMPGKELKPTQGGNTSESNARWATCTHAHTHTHTYLDRHTMPGDLSDASRMS